MRKWISNILIVLNVIQIFWIAKSSLLDGWYMYIPYLAIHVIFIILSIIAFLCVRGFGRESKLTLFLLILPLVYGGFFLYLVIAVKTGFIY